jgi:hypothetical protein
VRALLKIAVADQWAFKLVNVEDDSFASTPGHRRSYFWETVVRVVLFGSFEPDSRGAGGGDIWTWVVAEDRMRRDGKTWSDHFEVNLRKIAVRKAPLWNQGLIEGIWLIRIDSRRPVGARIVDTVDMDAKGTDFFTALLAELYLREPTLKP